MNIKSIFFLLTVASTPYLTATQNSKRFSFMIENMGAEKKPLNEITKSDTLIITDDGNKVVHHQYKPLSLLKNKMEITWEFLQTVLDLPTLKGKPNQNIFEITQTFKNYLEKTITLHPMLLEKLTIQTAQNHQAFPYNELVRFYMQSFYRSLYEDIFKTLPLHGNQFIDKLNKEIQNLDNPNQKEKQALESLPYWEVSFIAKDFQHASEWYTKFKKDPYLHKTELELGKFYEDEVKIHINLDKAFFWFLRSAKKNNVNAQNKTAWCYKSGWGIEKNREEAFEWWKKAANQNHIDAQYMLGRSYEEGKGVKQNQKEAVMWYEKANALGQHHDAKNALERINEYKDQPRRIMKTSSLSQKRPNTSENNTDPKRRKQ